jgi:hypothetical protein
MTIRNAHRFLFAIAAICFVLSRAISAQSLADVARAEEARRKTVITPVKVYTNDTVRDATGGDVASRPATPRDRAADSASKTTATAPVQSSPSDARKDETYWRGRISEARAQLQRSQAFVEALKSQVPALYAEFVATDDPVRRAEVEKKRLAAIDEQHRVNADIARLTKAISDIEEEARRANVPAGWLR